MNYYQGSSQLIYNNSFHVLSKCFLGCSVITSSNCDVVIHSELPSICYASSTTSCSGNLSCSTDYLFEWLYPNFTVITTTDETARVYGKHLLFTISCLYLIILQLYNLYYIPISLYCELVIHLSYVYVLSASSSQYIDI